jgi:hypothetical protein
MERSSKKCTLCANIVNARLSIYLSILIIIATIGTEIVSQAIHEMYASPSIRVIMAASLHQKLFIHSFMGCTRESGVGESDFGTASFNIDHFILFYNHY